MGIESKEGGKEKEKRREKEVRVGTRRRKMKPGEQNWTVGNKQVATAAGFGLVVRAFRQQQQEDRTEVGSSALDPPWI